MDRLELETLNRAIGYCQALWHSGAFTTLIECKLAALEFYGIEDHMMTGKFFELTCALIPSDK